MCSKQRQRPIPVYAWVWNTVSNLLIVKSVVSVVHGILCWIFAATLPLTSSYLAQRPATPDLSIVDCRCNRVKLKFRPNVTSIFNKDSYEIQHALATDDSTDEASWKSDPESEYPGRVVAPLVQDTAYNFRLRAKNVAGTSEWSQLMTASTLLRPVDGGSLCEGYKWTQNGIEVTIEAELPSNIRAKDVTLQLRPTWLKAFYIQDSKQVIVFEGELPRRVRSLTPEGNSHWELNREGDQATILLQMEKEVPARNIKFDFWRCAFSGHPEIDTHYITSDPHVKALQPVANGPGPGFQMQTLQREDIDSRPELKSLRGRKPKITQQEVSTLPAHLQQMYKQ